MSEKLDLSIEIAKVSMIDAAHSKIEETKNILAESGYEKTEEVGDALAYVANETIAEADKDAIRDSAEQKDIMKNVISAEVFSLEGGLLDSDQDPVKTIIESGHKSDVVDGVMEIAKTDGSIAEEIANDIDKIEMRQKIKNELNKAFSNPMTNEQLEEYERMATETNEKTLTSKKRDDEMETRLQGIIDSHSAIAENPAEFYELLLQMDNMPSKPNGFDFIDEYYQHELSHNQKADELDFINKGFRILILKNGDDSLSFLPAQATEPKPDWSLKEYYEKTLAVLGAPGSNMSDGDKADYADFQKKLESLG